MFLFALKTLFKSTSVTIQFVFNNICTSEMFDKNSSRDGRQELEIYYYKVLTLYLKWHTVSEYRANIKEKISQMKRWRIGGVGEPQIVSMALLGAVPRKSLTVRDSRLCVGFSYKIKL